MRLTLALLLALAWTTPALAYPGERDAMTNPLVRQTVQIAQDFWHARGVQPCATPNVMLADSLEDEDAPGVDPVGRADVNGCNVWLAAWLVAGAQDLYTGGNPTLELCTTVVHELGHTAGLEHSEHGVMGQQGLVDPWACVVWARRVDRRKSRAFERLHGKSARVRHGIG